MDNIKNFEDFLDRMQGLLDSAKKQGHIIVRVEDLENTFPELKESSEGKKIKKQIISFLKEFERDHYRNLDFSSWIAWLEKQSTPQVRTGLEWVNTIDDACDKRYAEEYAHGEYCHEQSFKWGFQEGVDWLEKQGEPTDINPSEFDLRLNKLLKQFETLPKEELANCLSFYLNVVQNDGTYKIDEKQDEQKPADKVEPKFKVGDWILIDRACQVKSIDNFGNYAIQYYDSDFREGYVLLKNFCESSFHLWTINDAKDGDVLVTPLTKGCEAGEQIFVFKGINSRDYVDNCIEYYCRICQGVFYENKIGYMGTTSETFYPATKKQRDTLMNAMADAGYTFDFEKKELKKIEQKPAEWSEEDEEFLRRAIKATKDVYPVTADWLKSLKPQNDWKPTKEQMEALHDLNLTGNISYAGQGQVLIELYKQLEKL